MFRKKKSKFVGILREIVKKNEKQALEDPNWKGNAPIPPDIASEMLEYYERGGTNFAEIYKARMGV